MPITVSGNDIEFTGTVRVVNGFNPDTGVAYLILTPDGGVGSLPFLAQGLPGLPDRRNATPAHHAPSLGAPAGAKRACQYGWNKLANSSRPSVRGAGRAK